MLGSGGHNIDSCGIDAAVTQNVCQLRNILLNAVEGPGEQFPQIMGKYFGGIHLRGLTQPLHLGPDIAAVQGVAIAGDEDPPVGSSAFFSILQQQLLQLARNENRPRFTFASNRDLTLKDRLYRKVSQLRHPDPGAADGLDHQIQLLLMPGSFQKADILRFGQLLFFRTIGLMLTAQIFYLAV